MTSAFLSYQRKPSAMLATLIARELRERGLEVYLDTERMDSAGAFPDRLKEGIRSSDVFICIVGSTTFESAWVQAEIKTAVDYQKPMIPVFQESYQQAQSTPDPIIKRLLDHDGILIFDVKNVYIDESIEALARMIENTVALRADQVTPAAGTTLNLSVENLAGQTLGAYQLKSLLGMGGMGAVYQAYQPSLNRDVALKVLSTALSQNEDYARRFMREAQTAAALEHAHIVPVHDYGTDRGFSYVAMRLLTGGSMADRMANQKAANSPLPSLAEVADVVGKLASALDYAHRRGVIHRDIKPNNIMFDEQGTPFLVDFGIAKLTGATTSLTRTGAVLGTPSYMAPEQWRGEGITPETDQYALGVLAYGLITGHMPFEASTPFALMHQHLNEPPPPPETWRADLPPALQSVLNRALAKEPSDRYPSVRDFAQAFSEGIDPHAGENTGFFTADVSPAAPPPVTPVTPAPTHTAEPVAPTHIGQTMPTVDLPAKGSGPNRGVIAGVAGGIVLIGLLLVGLIGTQPGGFLAAVPTDTPTSTATATLTASATATATQTATATSTASPTVTASPSATSSNTPLPTATEMPTETRTPQPSATAAAVVVPADTATPEPPTAVPGNVLLLQDDVSFTVYNQSRSTVSLEGVVFRSSSGRWNARAWGVSIYGNVPPENCLRLRNINSGQRQPPSICSNLLGLQLAGSQALFWMNTESYDVVRDGEIIATCSTDADSCEVLIS